MIATATLLDWMKADAADTAMLRILEQAAVKAAEKITGRYLGVAAAVTEIIRFKNWPLSLANEPVGGAITSLSQWDGSTYALIPSTDYYVEGSFIWSNASFVYPPVIPDPQRFRVIYQAGYAGAGDVWAAPADIQQAVLLTVGHWFENREAVIVGTNTVEIPFSARAILEANARVFV